ncbi:MAG: hypothetical protein D6797_06065 [Bdellovibrio sp.]|nr:MAG: hypothetical protein D6797_06065 [Bdellovibrio sp.]
MKRAIPFFKVGDIVWGQIEEQVSDEYLIVSFDGDLVRVQNKTGQTLKKGDRISLQVTQISPLHLTLHTSSKTKI